MNKKELIEQLEATMCDGEVIIDGAEGKYLGVFGRQPITQIFIVEGKIIIS